MNYHYLDSSNQTAGPTSLDAIRALARAGTIPADPMVHAEGGSGWQLLSSLTPAAGTGTSWFPPRSTVLGDFVGMGLGFVPRVLSPDFVGTSLGLARRLGHYAVLVGAALTLLYGLFAAIKYQSFAIVGIAIVLTVAVAVAQFAASRFLDAADKVIDNTPGRVSSTAFFECAALLLLLLAVVMLVGGVSTTINLRSFVPLLPAVFGTVALTYLSALLLHPHTINVHVGEGSAGEEAIGILTTFFKAYLKLVPLFFFLLAVLGGLTLLTSFFGDGATAGVAQVVMQWVPLPINAPYGLVGASVLLVACLLPIFAYFMFLLQYLFLDVLRAILSVPAKLDALKR